MLKPKSVDLYLVYGCPSCGAEHTATREETIFPGGVLCGCGEKIRFKPIKTVVVTPHYEENRKVFTEKKTKNKQPEQSHQEVVDLLVGLGYNRLVARKKVDVLSHLKDEEILEIILKEKT